jgi:hypothetical protein
VWNGDPSKPASFHILRDNAEIQISYLPAETRRLIQLRPDSLSVLR